jgi:hypothetical protein
MPSPNASLAQSRQVKFPSVTFKTLVSLFDYWAKILLSADLFAIMFDKPKI